MTPKNPKNGKKCQKGMAPQKIYPPGVPNQEFAPLEVKNEKTGTVGKSRSLSGQVLWPKVVLKKKCFVSFASKSVFWFRHAKNCFTKNRFF